MTRTVDAQPRRPAKFAHFVLRTRDLERSLAWYATVVGMEVVQRGEKLAFLTYDEEHHRMALAETPVDAELPPGCVGLDHVAYGFDTLGDLLSHYRFLKGKGILPVLPINHGPTTSLYYQDPDGNRVEFQVDNYATEAELKGWMRGEAFEKNPLGVVFEPEKLIARYENGDPLEELIQLGSAS